LDPAAVEDELGVLVWLALIGQRLLPQLLGALEDIDGEILQIAVGVLTGGYGTRVAHAWRLRRASERIVDGERGAGAARQELQRQEDDDPGGPQSAGDCDAAAAGKATTTALVDYIGAIYASPPH
jgi:hypothetical protein